MDASSNLALGAMRRWLSGPKHATATRVSIVGSNPTLRSIWIKPAVLVHPAEHLVANEEADRSRRSHRTQQYVSRRS